MNQHSIEIKGKDILVDGAPVQLRSGAMHYFRIHPAYWKDRLLKLKQCGLNTVETYMAWNFHEAQEGVFDFTGWRDIEAFLKLVQELGLMAIVRPGPFICSEWDFGGIPAWLLGKPNMRIRCMNDEWIRAVERYFGEVLPRLEKLQWTQGGPIVMMQVENEYGSVGNDLNYVRHLYTIFRNGRIDVPLFISDSASHVNFADTNTIPETLLTANCRNHPEHQLNIIQKYRPGAPEIIMELWSGVSHKWTQQGWLTHDVADVERDVETLMKRNASFNFYMFHGGTSFGFFPGAVNEPKAFLPYLNSYDVDAPLDEAGNPTPKYFAIQKTIKKFCPEAFTETPETRKAVAYGRIDFTESAPLFENLHNLGKTVDSVHPEPMEAYGQAHGFILYSYDLRSVTQTNCRIDLENLADRAQIFIDKTCNGTIWRTDSPTSIAVPTGKLDILVENMGRTNTGMGRQSRFEKGITGVLHDGGRRLYNWKVTPLPLDDLSKLQYGPLTPDAPQPMFHRGYFNVDTPEDTWLQIPTGEKGIVWLNGFNLGKYWKVGPQFALYVPAPLLKKGTNELVILELHGLRNQPHANSIDFPDRAPKIPLLL